LAYKLRFFAHFCLASAALATFFRGSLALYRRLAEPWDVSKFLKRVDELVIKLRFSGYSYARLNIAYDASANVGTVLSELQKIYREEAFHEHDYAVCNAFNSDAP